MVDLLNDEFTEQEQQWYIANLYVYMNYHPTNDFPINLEHVFKMIGFANKGNAMKTIKSNFTLDEDYRILLFRTEKQVHGGHNKDDIMLNVDTFKNLCMIAKTEKGKEIRKYYVKLENIYNKIIKEEIEEQKILQENTTKLLEEKQVELERTKKQLETKTKLKVKKWYDTEPGDTVYAVKNNNSIKIGKTQKVKNRETHYVNDMFYIRKCYNCDLAEKVIHHILDKHRIENNKEYFDISDDLAIYTIDIVCDFLDKFINYSEELPQSNIKENFKISLELIKNISNEVKEPIQTNIVKQNIIINIKDVQYNNPNEFDKFITEYCELGEDYFTSPYDLLGAFRMWCRGALCTSDIRHKFSVYMKEKFVFKDKFIADYGSRFQIYVGIRPKKLEFNPDDNNNIKKYEEFFVEKCHVGYTFRIKYSNFLDTYKQWLKDIYPGYELKKDEIIELKAYFNRKFLITTLPGVKSIGLWGFQLKTDESPKYGLQTRKRKEVLKIDFKSNEILETYDSLIDASEKLQINNRTLWDYIKKSKVFDCNNNTIILQYKTM
jgi:phage anti-repressor protein